MVVAGGGVAERTSMVPKSVTVSSVGLGPRSELLGRVEGPGAVRQGVVERARLGNEESQA